MMNKQARIKLNKLQVYKHSKTVYDENFHDGVNIIRGKNSSGKSTIMDFIYFVLGSDYSNWKPEAGECDYVIGEFEFNSEPITLKREITSSSRQGMHIYWGSLEEALKNNIEGWELYPFRRSSNKNSYTQVLFRSLNIPEVISDGDSNVTMHQILRFIYIDQLSPPNFLMRPDLFDSAIIREAVSNTLLGSYDNSLFNDEIKLRDKKKELDAQKSELKNLRTLATGIIETLDKEKIKAKNLELQNQLNRISTTVKQIDDDPSKFSKVDKEIKKEFKELEKKISLKKIEFVNSKDQIDNISFEIVDSEKFIYDLKYRLNAIDDSIKMRETVGKLQFYFCPSCLSQLDHNPEDKNHCSLCKNETSDKQDLKNALKMKNEISLQIKESEQLLHEKKEKLQTLENDIKTLDKKIKYLQKKYNDYYSEVKYPQNENRDNLLIKRGKIEVTLLELQKHLRIIENIETLIKNINNTEDDIRDLELTIKTKRIEQDKKLKLVKNDIRNNAITLLRRDLPRENEFQKGTRLYFDFIHKNTYSLEEKSFFSASSMVYLKNCILYAIFFSSLNLNFMNYPRFILCDNMEDKGMEEDRSKNFQRNIVKLSENSKIKHQIIFSTSMIDDSLNNDKYCIGDFYTETNKSLKFQ